MSRSPGRRGGMARVLAERGGLPASVYVRWWCLGDHRVHATAAIQRWRDPLSCRACQEVGARDWQHRNIAQRTPSRISSGQREAVGTVRHGSAGTPPPSALPQPGGGSCGPAARHAAALVDAPRRQTRWRPQRKQEKNVGALIPCSSPYPASFLCLGASSPVARAVRAKGRRQNYPSQTRKESRRRPRSVGREVLDWMSSLEPADLAVEVFPCPDAQGAAGPMSARRPRRACRSTSSAGPEPSMPQPHSPKGLGASDAPAPKDVQALAQTGCRCDGRRSYGREREGFQSTGWSCETCTKLVRPHLLFSVAPHVSGV